ncbi:MAG: TIM barrel protein [Bacteroidota bacterium]
MERINTRRTALKKLALGTTGMLAFSNCSSAANPQEKEKVDEASAEISLKGKVNHSVCRWCYGKIPLEAFCEGAQDIGIKSIELTGPEEWPILKKYGLTCALANAPWVSLTEGFNNPANHEKLYKSYVELIDQAADAGLQQVIVFSGNRNGLSDEAGLENCAVGLDKVAKHAQKRNITVTMELLNSKVNHPDYQGDRTSWGAALVDKLGADNFKLLYDIYHMQIMEGDIIATIKKYKDYISHYHTGGVPGRNEIDETQELYYPAILQAIVDTGFNGFVAQEFIPKRDDKLGSLRQGVEICDV